MTGDNGLGKSFLLDIAWWALTRTWAGNAALPLPGAKQATIEYTVRGKARAVNVKSDFRRSDSSWPLPVARPPKLGIVVYVRIDGGFSVWDPARNYWRTDPKRADAYHFSAADVWDGLDIGNERVCEGLERDWVNWQKGNDPQFDALKEVLTHLSPVGELLIPGPAQRVFIGEGRERPTLRIGGQNVPVALASAGVRRILSLAYFVVWSWSEHRAAAKILGKKPEDRFDILFDEPETHLHPRWQRTILPSILAALESLRGAKAEVPQLIVASHAPLILASLEPIFHEKVDELVHLRLEDGKVVVEQDFWSKWGDVTNWLVSETFGLQQARSLESEQAIEAAEAFMRGESDLPKGLASREEIDAQLRRLLPDHDPFWPRWIVSGRGHEL